MFVNNLGQFYFGDMQPGDREATPAEIAAHKTKAEGDEKLGLLSAARASREVLIGRLTWVKTECTAALEAATAASDQPAINLQTANIAAITAAVNSLVNAFEDPRVVNSVNGEAKQAIQLVYAEIVQAFKVAAPALHARMKKLDTL